MTVQNHSRCRSWHGANAWDIQAVNEPFTVEPETDTNINLGRADLAGYCKFPMGNRCLAGLGIRATLSD
jgi:hypothetical protein